MGISPRSILDIRNAIIDLNQNSCRSVMQTFRIVTRADLCSRIPLTGLHSTRAVGGNSILSKRCTGKWLLMCSLFSYVTVLVPTVAIAWDADGFRSGASVADVERELATAGITGKPRVGEGGLQDAYLIPAAEGWLGFCKDRLFSYERRFEGRSLSAIATMIQVEIERRGPPDVKTTPPVRIGMKGLWFHWQQENEAFLIVLSQEDGKLEASKRYENVALRNPCLAK